MASTGGEGGTVRGGGGFHRLWDPPRPGHCLKVLTASSLGGQRRLDGGGPQPAEGTAEVGEYDAVLDQGGGGVTRPWSRYTWPWFSWSCFMGHIRG